MKSLSFHNVVLGFFGLIFIVLFYQAVRIARVPTAPPKEEVVEAECIGEALSIPYAYNYTIVEPHSCAPQCADGKQRYLLYTNGVATQCELLPGCNDVG